MGVYIWIYAVVRKLAQNQNQMRSLVLPVLNHLVLAAKRWLLNYLNIAINQQF
jgi:hypothetical protein